MNRWPAPRCVVQSVAALSRCLVDSCRVRWLQGLVSCSGLEPVACTRGLNLSWWIVGESGDKTYKTTKARSQAGSYYSAIISFYLGYLSSGGKYLPTR